MYYNIERVKSQFGVKINIDKLKKKEKPANARGDCFMQVLYL
jgi:hypothetical protein